MESLIQEVRAEKFAGVCRERPIALLSIIFTISWFYSMITLYTLVGDNEEKKPEEAAVRTAGEECAEKLLPLKSKAAALEQQTGAASRRASVSAACPFDVASCDEMKFSLAETPPDVKVRALGARGAVKVALIDIDGEESKLMGEQDVFGTTGRVLRIDNEGITWAWGAKEYRSLIWE